MAQTVSFDITPEKEASKLQFLRRQFFGAPPAVSRHDVDLSGKTAIITGANSGIGLECARQLLDLGLSKLIIAVRDEKLGYASYESAIAFAQRAEDLSPRLDIAILNAGVNRGSFTLNPTTGHEETLQTNYLSTVLLLLLLLRIFKKAESATKPSHTSPGRIAKFDKINEEPMLEAFDIKGKWTKRVSPSLAIINCANPGLCYGSELAREHGTIAAIFIRSFGRSAVGARTLVNAAVKQDGRSHGMAPFVYSKEAEKITQQLWEDTMKELSFAEVHDVAENPSSTHK
ncbi:putative short-chain dehydrogenase/reductase family protein [Daldinia loculata]|uniref:putative short-chain dehydrogenase/reductase family protein n=1 Tax=Daldinia loculata TaxID=103429 RepID=UPI0020C34D96|nr:putative short-chain dehydrogenase/reductase family protein [Daldinia loculata]KAI1644180.1 putative short-chain dehydrogenase/reductase family protein [Daldinia loculata]